MQMKISPLFLFKTFCILQQCDIKMTRFAFPDGKCFRFNSTSQLLCRYDIQNAIFFFSVHMESVKCMYCRV